MIERKIWTPGGCLRHAAKGTSVSGEGVTVDNTDLFSHYHSRADKLDLGMETVFMAWELVNMVSGVLSHNLRKALMLLLLALFSALTEGGTRVALLDNSFLSRFLSDMEATPEERSDFDNLISSLQSISRGEKREGLSEIFGTEHEYRPLVLKADCLCLHKYYMLEKEVAEVFLSRINSTLNGSGLREETDRISTGSDDAIKEVLQFMPLVDGQIAALNSEQLAAVCSALSGRVLMVSGPPGSGKTFIIGTLLRVMVRTVGYPTGSIALAAPTGKAAEKMSDALGKHLAAIPAPTRADLKLIADTPNASTLHRLLGYSPRHDRFIYNKSNPLSARLVIVDESSMIDLYMMNKLLQALAPQATVIFLGDADQLPSVEPGSVFRDFCRSTEAHKKNRVIFLKRGYRFQQKKGEEGNLDTIAFGLKEGNLFSRESYRELLPEKHQVSDLKFSGVEHLSPGDAAQSSAFLHLWYTRHYHDHGSIMDLIVREYFESAEGFAADETAFLQELFAHYEERKILCVTRITVGGTGSQDVNRWFRQQWVNEKSGIMPFPAADSFLPGEPVIVTKNDYRLNLYNGDTGLVLNVRTGSGQAERMAVFFKSGMYLAYPLSLLRGKVELAWAITIHKAQGSEYKEVAIFLPAQSVKPLTRELLYTAVTRAKESVIILGSAEVLKTGSDRFIERQSGLADMLGER